MGTKNNTLPRLEHWRHFLFCQVASRVRFALQKKQKQKNKPKSKRCIPGKLPASRMCENDFPTGKKNWQIGSLSRHCCENTAYVSQATPSHGLKSAFWKNWRRRGGRRRRHRGKTRSDSCNSWTDSTVGRSTGIISLAMRDAADGGRRRAPEGIL